MAKISRFLQAATSPVKKELVFFVLVFLMLIQQPIEWLFLSHEDTWLCIWKFVQGLIIELGVVYTATALVSRCGRKWFKGVMYSFFWMLMSVTYFLVLNFDMCISQQTLTVMVETTSQESGEFIDTYMFTAESLWSYAIDLAVAALIIVAECRRNAVKRALRRCLNRRWLKGIVGACSCLGVLLMLTCYTTLAFCNNSQYVGKWREFFPHDSLDPFSQTLHAVNSLRAYANDVDYAVEVARKVYKTHPSVTESEPLTVVYVLGESYNKHHAGIYGYGLNTTPNMAREQKNGNLFVFTDVVNFENFTSTMEKNTFCLNSVSNDEYWFDYPNFTTVFKRAGYDVWMWDIQRTFMERKMFTITVNAYVYQPELMKLSYTETNKEKLNLDGELVNDFKANARFTNKFNLVVFHLIGQHVSYDYRYPPSRAHFTADSIKRNEDYMDREHKETVAYYDNATRYNDEVINRIIDTIRDKNAVLVYMSDHGEEVYDYRNHRGRNMSYYPTPESLKYQNQSPFVVWCSDRYIELHPEVVKRIKASVDRPYMTDVVGHLLLTLGGVKTEYYNPEYDVISPSFKPMKRIVYGHADYDKIMKKLKE